MDLKNEDMNQVGQEVAKKRRVGNPAMTGDAIDITPTEQMALMEQSITLMNLPKIDLTDVNQVRDRINYYFRLVASNGNRPTVAGLAMSLNGMNRVRLYEIRTGNYGNTRGELSRLPIEVTIVIKNAYSVLEELMENYMQTGRINPVAGIFLAKNHFGYQDKQDIVITPNAPEADFNAKDIADRYALPDSSDSSGSDS